MLFKRCGPTNGLPVAFCGGSRRLPSFGSCDVGNEACHCVGSTLFPFNCNLDCASFHVNSTALSGSVLGGNRGVALGIPMDGINGGSKARIIRICIGSPASARKPLGDLGTFREIRIGTKGATRTIVALSDEGFRLFSTTAGAIHTGTNGCRMCCNGDSTSGSLGGVVMGCRCWRGSSWRNELRDVMG